MKIGVYEAKANFSRMIELAQAGEEIEITKNGRLAAKIVGVKQEKKSLIGMWKGRFEIPADFNDPIDDETIAFLTGDAVTSFAPDEDPS